MKDAGTDETQKRKRRRKANVFNKIQTQLRNVSAYADDIKSVGNHFMFEHNIQFQTGDSRKRTAQQFGSRITDAACMPNEGSKLPDPDWRNLSCTTRTGDTE